MLGEVSAAAASRRRVGGIQDQITHYQRRVREDYLAPRRLTQELDLIQRLTG